MRTDLQQRFEREAALLPVFREQATARSARWVYSTEEIWSWRDLRARGSDSSLLPGPDGAMHACGHDAAGRPIVLQQFRAFNVLSTLEAGEPVRQRVPTTDLLIEDFVAYEGEELAVTRFVSGKLTAVLRLRFQGRLLLELESLDRGIYSLNQFHYEGGRKVLQQTWSAAGVLEYEIVYGADGVQDHYRVRRDGARCQLFKSWPRGLTQKQVLETIRTRLIELVPPLVAQAAVTGPIYCVALAYDGEGNDPLPPSIGLGLESEREAWLRTHGREAGAYIWNPAEFQHFSTPQLELEDPVLEEACDRMNTRLVERDSTAPVARLLVEVSIALNRIAWPQQVRRTPDFLVYAVDYELAALRRNLKAVLPADRLAALKASRQL